jgi:6,7-dimethyl-8-ribityllumazine synthase
MFAQLKVNVDAAGLRIGVAVSRYHSEMTDSMRDAAIEMYVRAGGRPDDLMIVPTAGAFELPAICRAMAALQTRTGRPALDGAVAIGCIISGQTTHDQYLAQAVTHGLSTITAVTGFPIAFGVLTCQTIEQARARSILAGQPGSSHRVNKGAEAMAAAIHQRDSFAQQFPRVSWIHVNATRHPALCDSGAVPV